MTTIEIGTIFAVILGLAKIIELLVQFIIRKASPEVMAEKQQHKKMEDQIQHLYDMHDKHDSDGTPIWYMPRSWTTTQKEILDAVQSIANTQEKLAMTMERMSNTMDRIDRRHHGEA